jgi:hypothetical protein
MLLLPYIHVGRCFFSCTGYLYHYRVRYRYLTENVTVMYLPHIIRFLCHYCSTLLASIGISKLRTRTVGYRYLPNKYQVAYHLIRYRWNWHWYPYSLDTGTVGTYFG